jgi:hypothetical protein
MPTPFAALLPLAVIAECMEREALARERGQRLKAAIFRSGILLALAFMVHIATLCVPEVC